MKTFGVESRQAASNTSVNVIHLDGVLDINTVSDFESELKGLLSKGFFKIVLNMAGLTYISSAGYGVLMSTIKDVRRKRGDIKISNVRPDVFAVFQLLELPGLFHILKTEQDAVNEF